MSQINDQLRTHNVTLRRVRATTVAVEKKYYIFWVTLGIQHAMRMRRMSSVAGPALHYFPTLSHKRHDFRGKKNVTEHKVCVLIFSTTLAQNISLTKKNSARYSHKCT